MLRTIVCYNGSPMTQSTVFFKPVQNQSVQEISAIAKELLVKVVKKNTISLEKKAAIKVHTGEPGNITFIRPEHFNGVIDYLEKQGGTPHFVETNTVTGARSKGSNHQLVAKKHGFTRVPFIVADGENGDEDVEISVPHGKHFSSAHIATQLANQKQIIVMSHFKGHIASGFGGAIKMLGIGFASRKGKMDVHIKNCPPTQKTINWSEGDKLHRGDAFCERVAEYALAAVNKKQYIYVNFMLNITKDCDCDGTAMKPIYKNVGVFASTDPVAIDKACYDMLKQREGKSPFTGETIFKYAEDLGLGSQAYTLVSC